MGDQLVSFAVSPGDQHELAHKFRGEVTLVSVPEGSESDDHADKLQTCLDKIADSLRVRGIQAWTLLAEGEPVQAILGTAEKLRSDLVMMVSHGRGGVERMDRVKLGSVVEDVIEQSPCPVFMVSAEPEAATAPEPEPEDAEPEPEDAEPPSG